MIEWMGGLFTPEQYVLWTRIQCTAWTLADFVIVFGLLRISDRARAVCGRPGHVWAYGVLLATAPVAAVIPFARRGGLIFVIELLVTVPHFVLILWVLIADAGTFARALSRLVEEKEKRQAA
ncbi:MAG: hypothetical protein GWP08_00045 [Nitrospiraceae bacterium]|nr:hypothetical protein [Nitrospiraceae bacterium]